MSDPSTFVAVSSTTVKACCLDSDGKPAYQWQESGSQPQGSVNWLKNGKAFLTTQGGNVAVVVEKDKEKPHVILSLPSGPLLGRVSGDGKCLVLVQSGVPGSINVYDLQSLLTSTTGSASKPPVVLQDHDRPILAIAASHSTTHVASSNSMGAVYLHEAGSGVRSTLGALPGGPMLVTPKRCLAFSQVNKPLRLAAGADDGQVIVWQIMPMASGPVVMPNKLRGRVMGVGFATYKKQPSQLLLACSESGQLVIMDLRHFPNIQAQGQLSVELSVAVSCMVVREDGQLVAVGTKDGRVGLIRMEDITGHGQNVTKLGCIRVFDLGTHLDVVDIAFQRIREPRDSRDSRDHSRENTPVASAAPVAPSSELASTTQQEPPSSSDAADGRPGSGRVEQLSEGELLVEEPPLKRHATYSILMAAGLTSQRQSQPEKQDGQGTRSGSATTTGPSATTTTSQRQQPASTTNNTATGGTGKTAMRMATATVQPGTATASGRGAAATSGPPPGQTTSSAPQGPSFAQPPVAATRHSSVPPVVIPGIAPPAGYHRRPSDVGGVVNASCSTISSGAQGAAEEGAGGEGQAQPSPVTRALASGGVASTSSPASSPRPRSPRATMSGGGHPPIRAYGTSSGADALSASGLRAYLDDFRQEVRDLVRGLQADMVRQIVAAEMSHRNDIAQLQQEIGVLWGEVRRISQQLDANLRFGLLSQHGAPWQ